MFTRSHTRRPAALAPHRPAQEATFDVRLVRGAVPVNAAPSVLVGLRWPGERATAGTARKLESLALRAAEGKRSPMNDDICPGFLGLGTQPGPEGNGGYDSASLVEVNP